MAKTAPRLASTISLPHHRRWSAVWIAVVGLAAGLILGAGAAPAQGKAPNLVVSSLTKVPDAAVLGRSLRLKSTVRNAGNATARSSVTRFYLGFDDARLYGGTRLGGSQPVGALKRRKATASTTRVTVPAAAAPGDYLVLACADDTNRVRESKEGDNCASTGETTTITDAPTALDLIERAIADGDIDAETGLLYKVYAASGDPRLPSAYEGAPLGEIDSGGVLQEATGKWNALSEDLQEQLDPFFTPPIYDGAYRPSVAMASARRGPTPPPFCRATEAGPRPLQRAAWSSVDTAHFRVWYFTAAGEGGFADDPVASQTSAQKVAGLAEHVYGQEVAVFDRAPLGDGGLPCNGEDNRIDVYMGDYSAAAKAQVVPYPPGDDGRPGYIWIDPAAATTDHGAQAVFAHEFAHVVQLAFDYAVEKPLEYGWLEEASANWAIDYVYQGNQFEQDFAPSYLHQNGFLSSLGECESFGCGNGYRDYLFLFFLTHKLDDPDAMGTIWAKTLTLGSIAAVDQGFPGGFRDVWPDFALYNLNRDDLDHYQDWDSLTHALKTGSDSSRPHVDVELEGANKRKIPLRGRESGGIPLDDLSFNYTSFEFSDDKVRSVKFEDFGFRDDPCCQHGADAHVRAFIKLADGTTRTENWSDGEERSFCRDREGEDVEELILFWANSKPSPYLSDSQPALFPRPAAEVEATKRCLFPNGFGGSAGGSISNGSLTETWEATVPYERTFKDETVASYGPTGGTVNWEVAGSVPCNDGSGANRTVSGTASWPYYEPTPEFPVGLAEIVLFGPGMEPEEYADTYSLQAYPGPRFLSEEVNLGACPNTDAETVDWVALNCGFDAEYQPWNGSDTLAGSRTYQSDLCGSELELTFNWNFGATGGRS